MEEVGAQVARPIYIHQALPSRLYEVPPMAKKRDLPYHTNFQQQQQQYQQFTSGFQNPKDSWNRKGWDWDSTRFVAKPIESDALHLGTATTTTVVSHSKEKKKNDQVLSKNHVDEDESLRLKLGGGGDGAMNSVVEQPPVSRPSKRVRSGSPGGTNHPTCQVDNCKEDLSNAKDYHRRHKVCEVHSKATRALVGKQMQRFCQQCSRFHPLSEFDEGKRSCRRRLAGHNRRRRKTQPEDVTSQLLLPGNRENTNNGSLDIVNLLTVLARAQGNNENKISNGSPVPDRDHLIQILSKINSLPLTAELAAKLSSSESLSRNVLEQASLQHHNRLSGNASSPTMDLLAALSGTQGSAPPGVQANLPQGSSQSSDSEKTKLTSQDQGSGLSLQNKQPLEFRSVGGEMSSTSYQSPVEDSDCQVQETRLNLPLQLFSSSPEDDSPPKLATTSKYFSSDSSTPMDDRSPSSSPVVQTLFPVQASKEVLKPERMCREFNRNVEGSRTHGSGMPLELFRGSNRGADISSFQSSPYQAGYASSSGSDHSPSSLNSDAQDRTGRIMFKLFDKDPSHFPGTLRTQIYNWLSIVPSEMESYIRPGCVVLSLYVSMSSAAWEQLEENLFQRVNSLIQDSDSDFWRNGRFLIHTGRQLASHKDGKIRLSKSWSSWSAPELILVTPLAVVGGQETPLLLKGRNLTNFGTKIHCTYMGGYTSSEVPGSGSTHPEARYDEISLRSFKVHGAVSGVLGRCFIEVENGFKGNSFPLIIADASICRELRLLESEIDEAKMSDVMSVDNNHDVGRPRSREEVLHFLNELGWLFQRKSAVPMLDGPDYLLIRFKFLLTFSVERDCCALVKRLLDILVQGNLGRDGLSGESLRMLSEVQLLNRAIKRKCRNMVDLLIHYSVTSSEASKKFIFPPNLVGPGGVTPLHLAASTLGSEDMVDALTNDPSEIGLNCWASLVDANGQSPYSYAMMRNNHSYNTLVAQKLADRRNGQVSVSLGSEIEQAWSTSGHSRRLSSSRFKPVSGSCAKCAIVATKVSRRIPGTQGLLHRPYVHSMLAIAAVCVCVCLFFRGSPEIGLIAPFKWENLDFGTS